MRREGKLLINTFLIFFSFQFLLNECVSGQTLKGQEDKVIIGLNVPLTGSYSDQGKDEEMAYKLAIEQINAKGGVLGKKNRIYPERYENGCSDRKAKRNKFDTPE
jgi:ABC-type branched-subunit amino acid transport system substrate-binding protein